MKFIILILISVAFAERLTVDMYLESLCPYCNQFVTTSLKNELATEGVDKVVALRIIPYGNATKTTNKIEKRMGTVEGCAQNRVSQKYAPNNELQQVQVVECIESNLNKTYSNSAFNTAADYCSISMGYDVNDVIACANGNVGSVLHLIAGQKTDALVPDHQQVPWFVSERQHNETDENLMVCNNYKGTETLDACLKIQQQ